MPRKFEVPKGVPLLDIASFARGGPNGGRLSPAQLEQIQRTVQRVPEVMVKVLPRGSNDLKAAGKHLDYISRKGELELETEDGQRLQGRGGTSLLEDWDLDIDDCRPQSGLGSGIEARPKLIHKLMFSMPPGTPPAKVLLAVRNFAREEFALKNRYAFVLHTDEPHPHVHFVLKAVGDDGFRLNIRKATLRFWRSEFARHLRLVGVAANATERQVRGSVHQNRKAEIYRPAERGELPFSGRPSRVRATSDAHVLKKEVQWETQVTATRRQVEAGWVAAAGYCESRGMAGLARDLRWFATQLPSVHMSTEAPNIPVVTPSSERDGGSYERG